LSPYFVKLGTFYIILILLVFLGKVTTQLRCGGNCLQICAQIISDHNIERLRFGVQLTQLFKNNLDFAFTGSR